MHKNGLHNQDSGMSKFVRQICYTTKLFGDFLNTKAFYTIIMNKASVLYV